MSSDRAMVIDGFGVKGPKGPPGWDQLVYIKSENPYYVPNPSIITAALCLLVCFIITTWAAFTTRGRKNKVSNPIIQYFFGWPRCRFWITMALALISFSWAVFDNSFRLVNAWVEQRLFLSQFVFDAFWDFTQVFLLWNIYDLFFHLMRYAPLGQGTMYRLHFWRYSSVRKIICGLLFLFAFVMMCLRISYLSGKVFHPPTESDQTYIQYYIVENVAVALCFLRDIIYFLASLEVMVVSGVLLKHRKSTDVSGSKAAYVHAFIWIAKPLLLSGTFTFISTCVRPPPEANFGGLNAPGDANDVSLAVVQFAASMFGDFGVVLPLAGILMVSKRMDALMGKGERLASESSDSVDIILMARNLGMSDAYLPSLKSDGDRPGSSNHHYEVRIVGGSAIV